MPSMNHFSHELPQCGAELLQFLAQENTESISMLPEISEEMAQDCLHWIEMICPEGTPDADQMDQREEWLDTLDAIIRASIRASAAPIENLRNLGNKMQAFLEVREHAIRTGRGWWLLAGRAPTAPWSWIRSGVETGELSSTMEAAVIQSALERWFIGQLHAEDRSFINEQLRQSDTRWVEVYRKMATRSLRSVGVMALPLALIHPVVLSLPLPDGELQVYRAETGVELHASGEKPLALSWDEFGKIHHTLQTPPFSGLEVDFYRIVPDAEVEFDASLSALDRVIDDPEYPDEAAERVVDAVCGLLTGPSAWFEVIQTVSELFQNDEIVETEEWEAVARAVETRIKLDSLSARYLSPQIDAALERVDHAMQPFSHAVLAIPAETMEELLIGAEPTSGAWWETRRELDGAVPEMLLKRAVKEIEPEKASKEPEKALGKENIWDVICSLANRISFDNRLPKLFPDGLPSFEPEHMAADDQSVLTVPLFEDSRIRLFVDSQCLYCVMKLEAFTSPSPNLEFHTANGVIDYENPRTDTFVFKLNEPLFQDPSSSARLVIRDGGLKLYFDILRRQWTE